MDYTKEELIELFQRFIDECCKWYEFVEWLEQTEGIKPTEIGFESDE